MRYRGRQSRRPSCGTGCAGKEWGYNPAVPSCVGPEVPLRSPIRPRRLRRLSGESLFFNPGPFHFDPALDLRIIPFDGFALRFLWTPSQRPEEAANVIHMVADAKVGRDPLGHTGASPKVGGKSGRFGSSEELRFQFGNFLGIKPGWTTWGGFCLKGIWALGREGSSPSPHASTVYFEFLGDFDRRDAVFKESYCAPSSSFQSFWASGRSHVLPPAQSIGHYLCRCQ